MNASQLLDKNMAIYLFTVRLKGHVEYNSRQYFFPPFFFLPIHVYVLKQVLYMFFLKYMCAQVVAISNSQSILFENLFLCFQMYTL